MEKSSVSHLISHHSGHLTEGSVLFISPGQKKSLEKAGNISGFAIEFTEEFIYLNTEHKDILYRLPFFSYELKTSLLKIPKKEFDRLYSLVSNAFAEFREKKAGYEKILLSFLNIILLKCKRFSAHKTTRLDKSDYTSLQLTAEFRKLVNRNFAQEHFVSYYSNQLNQTMNYLNNVIKSVTGKKASDLIHERIVLEAKRLLVHTKLSPKEVAFELGFQDQSYFTKFFKHHTGCNPLQWFKMNK